MAMKKNESNKKLDTYIDDTDGYFLEVDSAISDSLRHLGNDSGKDRKIHRGIYVSTVSPTNSDGQDGDIWITIEE